MAAAPYIARFIRGTPRRSPAFSDTRPHTGTEECTMIDFLEQHALYVVLLVTLLIWTGLFLYVLRVDLRLRKLES
jgi:CcmD family protein